MINETQTYTRNDLKRDLGSMLIEKDCVVEDALDMKGKIEARTATEDQYVSFLDRYKRLGSLHRDSATCVERLHQSGQLEQGIVYSLLNKLNGLGMVIGLNLQTLKDQFDRGMIVFGEGKVRFRGNPEYFENEILRTLNGIAYELSDKKQGRGCVTHGPFYQQLAEFAGKL